MSTITKVESEFDDVYRITTDNGLILDIFEKTKPVVGQKIEYSLGQGQGTTMNGIVFAKTGNSVNASFGGFLASIPDITHSVGTTITIFYTLQN